MRKKIEEWTGPFTFYAYIFTVSIIALVFIALLGLLLGIIQAIKGC